MPQEGEVKYVQGSGAKPYELKNTAGVLSCSCPAWRNQSAPVDRRTCKHLKRLLGEAAELARVAGGHTVASNDCGAGCQEHHAAEEAATRKLRPDEKAALNGPPVLLAHAWDSDTDPTGWWASEKLDGVRAWWDGKNFISRQGNVFHAPAWFKEGLPASPLDGELWMGRKKFQQTISVVRSGDAGERWKQIRYAVFDVPTHGGTFEERQAALKALTAPYAFVLEHGRLDGIELLKATLAAIVAKGGEGLMLRRPGSKYEAGRSYTCLKVKPFVDDEAVVVGHEPGKGKHKDRLGALICRAKNGNEFNVGTGLSDKERGNPPPVGSTITFRYTELTEGGAPRFPRFVAVRNYE